MKKPAQARNARGKFAAEEPHVEEPTERRPPLLDAPAEAVPQETSLAIRLSQAEIEQQVKIAISNKRSITVVSREMEELVGLDPTTAEECIYALPRAGKTIRGPSIRFAEIIFSRYRNCRSAARVIHVDRIERFVEAEGVFWDLETGAQTVMRTQRSIQDSKGHIYNADMIIMTGNAACAIAKRNAITAGIPRPIWRSAFERANEIVRGSAKTLVERRSLALKTLLTMGISNERVFATLGIGGERDIGLDELQQLTEMRTAIRDNEATVDELFPEVGEKGKEPPPLKTTRERMEALSGSGEKRSVSGRTPEETAGGDVRPTTPPAATAATSPTGAGEDAPLPLGDEAEHYPDEEEAPPR